MSLSFPLVPPSISLRKSPPVSCLEAGLCSKPTWTSLPRFHPLPRYCLQPWLQSPESLQSDFRRARAHDFLLGWVGEGTAGGDLQTWAPCLTPSFMVPFSVLLPSQRSVGVIGLLLVSISFGRQVCWGHPQLCQFSHCLSVTFLSFTLPLILHLQA